jgi:hypothetical protein
MLLLMGPLGTAVGDGRKPPNPEVVGARFEGLKAKFCLDVELDAKLDAKLEAKLEAKLDVGETAAKAGAAAKSVLMDGERACNGEVEKESCSLLAPRSGETAAEVAMMYCGGDWRSER